jgi:FAD:protein FMN transferase
MLTIEFQTMGGSANAVLDAEGPLAREVLDQLPEWCKRRERLLSRFDPQSALSQLNARGSVDHVDELLFAAIEVALQAAADSEGLVTPTILPALEAAGFDRSFEKVAREQDGELAPPSPAPDWRTIRCDPQSRTVRLPPNVKLDLGGTSKGWLADAAAAVLSSLGPALVDLGGDIASRRPRRDPWPIAIEDPNRGRDPLELVTLRTGGIATSGRDVRRWKRAGKEQHHIIDPRIGAPAITDVWTVTVIAPSALTADVAAKRVLVEGSEKGLAWIESEPTLAALVVCEGGHIKRSSRLDAHVYRETAS